MQISRRMLAVHIDTVALKLKILTNITLGLASFARAICGPVCQTLRANHVAGLRFVGSNCTLHTVPISQCGARQTITLNKKVILAS